MEVRVKGCKDLYDEVINTGLCTFCGACAGGCPYLVPYRGRMVVLDKCTLAEGQCYRYCPRTYTDMDAISQSIFGMPYSDAELGMVTEVMIARSTDEHMRQRAQYGATVTALLSLALEEGFIDGAVLARTGVDKVPAAHLARSASELLDCAGSNYMACPVLEALNRLTRDSRERLGVVALPCQALALAKMKKDPPENRVSIENVKVVIGLFCTWALSADGFPQFLQEHVELSQVVGFDIPPPPASRFDAYVPSGKVSLPLDEIRPYVMPTCAYCLDMTSEFADVSVGVVEGLEGWNTVLVRSNVGARLVENARSKGRLETALLPPDNLAHLKDAALLKKRRALREIVARTGDQGNLLYLGLPQALVDRLLGGGE